MKRRVVIVEDDKQLRADLRRTVDQSEGYVCIDHFGNAEMALKVMPRLNPDLVLMDIELPGMNGIDCAARLKRELPDTQILVLTSYEDSDRVFEALKAGVCGYLVKWDTVDNLIERLDEVFHGGSPMSSHIARKVVQYFYHQDADPPGEKKQQLSPREVEILKMIANGYIYKEIAAKLEISSETVKTHMKRVYDKLHIRSRVEAVLYLTKHQKG